MPRPGCCARVSGGGDVTQIVRFKDMSAHGTSSAMSRCHGNSHKQAQSGSSTHLSNNVGCLDCHSRITPLRSTFWLTQPQLCYGCHGSSRADFAKPFRHQ
jgi:hypothetical protein